MILRSPTENENGEFPFVARMEQSVIRVSLHSRTPLPLPRPMPPSWIPLRSIQATILRITSIEGTPSTQHKTRCHFRPLR